MSATLDRILADDYLDGLETLDMADLRSRRAECKRIETGLSYLRRMVQGKIDVLAAEQARRAEGGEPDDLEALVERLPAVLAERTRSGGLGSLQNLDTGEAEQDLVDELDDLATPSQLADPSALADDALVDLLGTLREFEAKVSGLRREMFGRIDALEAELTRRYRTGEASVDSLLH